MTTNYLKILTIVGALAVSLLISGSVRNARAQNNLDALVTYTYHVDVKYRSVHLGLAGTTTYWDSVFESENKSEARLVYEVMLEAFEDGDLDYLNSYDTTVYTKVIDIRFRTETKINNNLYVKPNSFKFKF